MSFQQTKKWRLHPSAPPDFLRTLPEHPILAQVLYNRGLRTAGDAAAFLRGSDAVRHDPIRLADMVPAVARLVQAVERQETICVYGDFDADGVSSTALLVLALQAAGAQVGPYIPDRVDEGYGLNLDAISRIAAGQARVLVTVDCGIRSYDEVAAAAAYGLDVIVTDHHTVGPHLPPALAVINPRRADCPSRFKRLAGVGVAYRLAQALLRAVAEISPSHLTPDRAAELEESLLDLVAIGTVADMMPLLGDNRTLVTAGLARLNASERPGLQALLAQADLRPGAVDAAAIAYRLAPRLNAAGRLAHAKLAYDLLRTNDPVRAYTLATELEALNRERRVLTEAAQVEAAPQVAAQMSHDAPVVAVRSRTIRSGIVGLVAGRLTDRLYRPVLVIEEGDEESRGSARSIPELDITAALDEVGDLLVRYGGHARAAGFTVRTVQMVPFLDALRAVVRRELAGCDDLRPTLDVDGVVGLEAVHWGLQEQFARLEPTGQDNPPPLLLGQGLRVREARAVGGGRHLKLVLDQGGRGVVFDAIAFDRGELAASLGDGAAIDAVFELGVNEWQGRRLLQLNVQDLRPAQGAEG